MQGRQPIFNNSSRLRVMIADDSTLVREQVKTVLGELPVAQVVGEAKTSYEAVEFVNAYHPDMVILNLHMHGCLEVDILSQIKGAETSNPAFVLANFSSADRRTACVKAGEDLFFDRALEVGKVNEIMKILVQPHASVTGLLG